MDDLTVCHLCHVACQLIGATADADDVVVGTGFVFVTPISPEAQTRVGLLGVKELTSNTVLGDADDVSEFFFVEELVELEAKVGDLADLLPCGLAMFSRPVASRHCDPLNCVSVRAVSLLALLITQVMPRYNRFA